MDKDEIEGFLKINMRCFQEDIKLLLVWHLNELADYLESFSTDVQPIPIAKPEQTLIDILTGIRGISNRNATALLDKFGSMSRIYKATQSELMGCVGIGRKKAQALIEFFTASYLE